MEDDKFNYRDMTRQFLENISQGDYEESVRNDGLLVEAKKKAKKKTKSKKKEPNYGDGAYFEGGPAADVKAREDAWAGGDNVFNAIDHSKAVGSEPVTTEQEIMSITELRAMIDREMRMISEVGTKIPMFSAPQNVDTLDALNTLRQNIGDEQVIWGLLAGDADLGVEAVDQLSKTIGMPGMLAFEEDPYDDPMDAELGMEDFPTETAPMQRGSDDFTYEDLRRQHYEKIRP
jgi:hypothetical protein